MAIKRKRGTDRGGEGQPKKSTTYGEPDRDRNRNRPATNDGKTDRGRDNMRRKGRGTNRDRGRNSARANGNRRYRNSDSEEEVIKVQGQNQGSGQRQHRSCMQGGYSLDQTDGTQTGKDIMVVIRTSEDAIRVRYSAETSELW
jgi:hypothetical protein